MVPKSLTAPILANPKITHGFFSRRGGVCQGLQDGQTNDLSAGFSPMTDPGSIQENRRRVAHEFGHPFVTAKQVHGAEVLTVTEPWDPLDDVREADGLVTTQRKLGLGILTADCGPIVFADLDQGVIGACHAGWRGVKAGVIDATVRAMVDLGARRGRILAVLGPCMGRMTYEVGLDFPDNFKGALDHHRSYFRPAVARDKLLFDMPRAIRSKLEDAGIRRPHLMDRDTYIEKADFFSFRRATHNKEADYGRQISLIALN